MLQKIISGGQTGADRAALDAAIKFNLPYGGMGIEPKLPQEIPTTVPDHKRDVLLQERGSFFPYWASVGP